MCCCILLKWVDWLQIVLGPAVDGGFYLIAATVMPEDVLNVSQCKYKPALLLGCVPLAALQSLQEHCSFSKTTAPCK